jgi:hypothetical protein
MRDIRRGSSRGFMPAAIMHAAREPEDTCNPVLSAGSVHPSVLRTYIAQSHLAVVTTLLRSLLCALHWKDNKTYKNRINYAACKAPVHVSVCKPYRCTEGDISSDELLSLHNILQTAT